MHTLTFAQSLEGAMLICFGVSWPLSILKALRTRRTEGKSLAFAALIFVGYLMGFSAKVVKSGGSLSYTDPIALLYAINALLVAIDIALYVHYRRAAPGA